MSPLLELDYIGFSPPVDDGGRPPPETELRLAPPGSDSPGKMSLTLNLLPSSGAKRGFSDAIDGDGNWAFSGTNGSDPESGKGGALAAATAALGGAKDGSPAAAVQDKKPQPPAAKAQVVGWPPIRNYRKNSMATNPAKNKEDGEGKQGAGCMYVKVSMDGAPYLRKVDLKLYCNYNELSSALEKMFSGFTFGQCNGQVKPGRDGLSETRLRDLLNGSEHVLTYEDKDGDWMLVGDVPWKMFTETCKRLRIMKGSDAIGLGPRGHAKLAS